MNKYNARKEQVLGQRMNFNLDTGVTVKRLTIPCQTREQLYTAVELCRDLAANLQKVLNSKNSKFMTLMESQYLIAEANQEFKGRANNDGSNTNYKGAK
tara:strand:- start:463 stop:759 length:297 start_codon:yes stop_codon:yes gene_type:complete